MALSHAQVTAYSFGPFRLNVADRILERSGERVLLTPKVIDTLVVLLQNAGKLVTKEALMEAVWPDVVVVESGLTRNISVLRKALEESVQEGEYIETIPRRGYRFVAEVTEEIQMEPEARTGSAQEEHSVEPVLVEVAHSGRKWSALVWPAAVVLLLLLLVASLFRPTAPKAQRPLEPGVRIGEHLLYKLAPQEAVRASDEFRQALLVTPNSAAAHAGLSIALIQTAALGLRPIHSVGREAEQAANRALQLDGNSAVAHYATGLMNLMYHWDLQHADRSFRRALQLDPNSVQTRFGYAQLQFAKGELNTAIELTEDALRLDPASPLLGARYCQALYYRRDFRRAEAECRRVLDRERNFTLANYYLALTLGWLGQTDQALRMLDSLPLSAGAVEVDRAWVSFRAGNREPALRALAAQRELIRQGKLTPSAKLLLCTILEQRDEAFEAIETGIASRAIEMLTLNVDPRLDSLRTDKRYPSVLRRIGVVPRS